MFSQEVAIVGSGVVGLSIAIDLLSHGASVTLFERQMPLAGASIAANGAITPYSDDTLSPAVRALAQETLAAFPGYLEQLHERGGDRVDYDIDGVLQAEFDEVELRSKFAAAPSHPEIKLLGPEEAKRIEPQLSDGVCGAIFYETESRIDTRQLLQMMMKTFDVLGGIRSASGDVKQIDSTGSTAAVVTGSGQSTFDTVVLATGGERVLYPGMEHGTTTRVRGDILEVACSPKTISRCLHHGHAFLTPRRDGRILLGTTYEEHCDDMDTNRETVSLHSASIIISDALKLVPILESAQLVRSWKGWRPRGADGDPVIGPAGPENIWLVDGMGGFGFTTMVAVSRRVGKSILQNMVDPGLISFTPNRFTSKQ